MKDKGKSYVYILTNKSFRDNLLKIGVSDKPMDELIEWLDNEDLPDPYAPFAIVQTEEANMLENAFHRLSDHFKDCQYNSEFGFYILPPEQVLGSLFTLVIELGIKDAVVLRYDEGAPRQVYPPVDVLQAQLEDMPDKD